MAGVSNDFSHLWNDLPKEERDRLIPYRLELERLHVWQCKQKAIQAHKSHIAKLNEVLASLEEDLAGYRVKL